jgi:drug/metabolite transporter (DMT)-like permease
MFALSLTGGIAYALFVYAGFTLAPATHGAVLLSGVLPFFTALVAYFLLGERADRHRLAGLALIALGVGCMAFDQLRGSPVSPLGDALLLAGSLCWGVYSVLLRRWQVPPWDATMGVALLSALLYLPLYLLVLPSQLATAPAGEILLQALYQGVLVVIVAMILFTRALAALGPVRLNMFMAMVPGLATLLAVPLLGESLSFWPLLGLACVSIGALQPWRWRRPL